MEGYRSIECIVRKWVVEEEGGMEDYLEARFGRELMDDILSFARYEDVESDGGDGERVKIVLEYVISTPMEGGEKNQQEA